MKYLLFILTIILFTSCGHFHDDPKTSVWAGSLWLAFWIPFLASLYFFYVSYKASKSNSTTQKTGPNVATGNIPIYKLAKFKFAVFLFVVSWAIVWYVNSPNWK